MSLDPHLPRFSEAVQEPVVVPRPRYRWYHKLSALLFIIFCLELGVFLLIFPWSEWWDFNFFASYIPEWHRYWESSYLRGAVSGLGVVNLYISLLEIFRLRRFSRY
jgi:hypothetical protein